MPADVHYFGIRHHGPGSAKRLLEALDELSPAAVLIEGPSDASGFLPALADPAMQPPVALLTYAADDPRRAVFWPFATFSPEYQAALWAHRNAVAVRFVDLPASLRLGMEEPDEEPAPSADMADAPTTVDPVIHDPIGCLAAAAGYEDGESWWSDVIEENPDPGPIFTAVADAMSALRDDVSVLDETEARREAYMRLEIAATAKEAQGAVAVVCGAWHVPALQQKKAAKEDRALFKGLKKQKIAVTWAPWTAPRLAFGSGYGAGVAAPAWCGHVWESGPGGEGTSAWLAKIARVMRGAGHDVSTASLIEAERLARAVAALRGRPRPGFEECRDAAISCLCFGEALVWERLAPDILIGRDVGSIPDDVPLAPLIEDLQRQQKKARLKPEALDSELSLDLRSDSGLFRSTLLHRLNALGVPWGTLVDASRSRGTFRERWTLRWEPEFSVRLVEHLVFGPTIEKAASGCLSARIRETSLLGELADLVRSAMTARLDHAADEGIRVLGRRAAQTSDCSELLAAVPPMADVVRYGEARKTDGSRLADLMRRIIVQAAIALPHAARDLDSDAATELSGNIEHAHGATTLAETGGDDLETWLRALETVLAQPGSTALVAGTAARLLYECDRLEPDQAARLLGRHLSSGISTSDAAGFFEGFLGGAAQRLIFDEDLRGAVDAWLCGLDEEAFVENLPIFRRVFSGLDSLERRRLLEAATGAGGAASSEQVTIGVDRARWEVHLDIIGKILQEGGPGG